MIKIFDRVPFVLRGIGRAILGGIIGGIAAGCVSFIPALVVGFILAANLETNVMLVIPLAICVIIGIFVGAIYGFSAPRWEKEEEQQRYYKKMVDIGEQSLSLFESTVKHLDSAEKSLDQAEVDFAEGAFAPFWDSIENAANWLAHFDEGVRSIKDNLSHYTELVRKYENAPPQFSLQSESVEKLAVSISTAERMKAIVRTAQRNFQFATIYEQRKTNQILVAGFTTLGQALAQMTRQIKDSIDNLTSAVNSMASTLDAINSGLGDIEESVVQWRIEQKERETRVLEMLDNIQRRREP